MWDFPFKIFKQLVPGSDTDRLGDRFLINYESFDASKSGYHTQRGNSKNAQKASFLGPLLNKH